MPCIRVSEGRPPSPPPTRLNEDTSLQPAGWNEREVTSEPVSRQVLQVTDPGALQGETAQHDAIHTPVAGEFGQYYALTELIGSLSKSLSPIAHAQTVIQRGIW